MILPPHAGHTRPRMVWRSTSTAGTSWSAISFKSPLRVEALVVAFFAVAPALFVGDDEDGAEDGDGRDEQDEDGEVHRPRRLVVRLLDRRAAQGALRTGRGGPRPERPEQERRGRGPTKL